MDAKKIYEKFPQKAWSVKFVQILSHMTLSCSCLLS